MSAQVGSAHIAIFPSLKGFKSRVRKDMKSTGTAASADFTSSMKGAGKTAGTRVGRDLKSALNVSANGLGSSALKVLNREVASASAGLSRARLKQQDEAGKVRVAETKLQAAIEKSGAGSWQAVAAEEGLEKARRAQAAAAEAVTSASARLKSAQEAVSKATASVTDQSKKASTGLVGMAKNLRAGYANAQAGKSAFTGIAGSIGGIAKEIVILGRNTTLGRWASLQAAQVSKQFTSLATMVGGGVAKALVTTKSKLAGASEYVRGAFAPMANYVRDAGTLMAAPFVRFGSRVSTWLRPVTAQVSGLFSKIGAAASPAVSRFKSAFSGGLAGIGSSVGGALQSVVGAAQRVGSAAGGALGSGLKNAATAGVTVAAAGIGVALGKGFGRLTALDTAQAKLRGLGHDADSVTQIMANASASVKGTAFGLGEAATVAGAAVAAQIKPGKELESHLKRVANNASAAGMSMEEMGSIFNKAATQANGVQNDVIGQLADRGIPIYQELAKTLGVTAGEVFKMASEGKIDFETFSKAAEAAAGTVAQEMGTTVPGAAKNFFAAMGRIGANALEGIYSKIGPLIQAATSALGPVEEMAKSFGKTLSDVLGPALDWLTNLLNSVGSGADGMKEKLSGLTSVLAPVGAAFVALGAGGLAGAISNSRILAPLLGGLSGPLAALGGPLGIAAAALAGFVLSGADAGALVEGLTGIIDQVVAALPGMVSKIAEFIPKLVSSILAQLPALITAAVGIVNALVGGFVEALPILVEGAVALLTGLIGAIVENLPLIIESAVQLVTALVQGLVAALPLLIEGAISLVTSLLTAIVAALPMLIESGVQLLMALVTGLIGALPMLLEGALTLITGLLTAIIDNLPMIIEAGIQLLLSLVTGLINALPQLITAAIQLVLQLVAGLLKMLPKLIEAGIQLIVALIGGLLKAIPQIIQMLPQIVSAIWNGLKNVNWLDLGMSIIQGIIDGIISMAGSVGDAIGDIVGGILDFFPHSPAKKGPLGPTGWRALKTSGMAMMAQFNDGAAVEAPGIADAITATADAAAARAKNVLQSASATISASTQVKSESAAAENSGRVYAPMNVYAVDPRVAATEMAEILRKRG